MFQAIASTLIYGKQDAVLVDAFMTVKQADALVDWVAASGKNLTTIYITHGHGDHWSLGVLGGLYVVIVVMENMIFRYTTCYFLLLRSE